MNNLQRWYVVQRLRSNFYRLTRDQILNHQKKTSDKLWSFVRRHSAYYRSLYPTPIKLSEVDPVNKTIMMANFNEITTRDLDRDSLINFRIEKEKTSEIEIYQGGYSIGLSSGTSGNRLLTVLSQKERNLYGCLLWARNGIPKSVPERRVLFALRTNNPAFTEVGSFGVHMVYVDYTYPVGDLLGLINKKRLNVLAGPPSLLRMIARDSSKIDHPIDAVISYAEVLDGKTKDFLRRSFQAPVVQIYQGAEGFIGSTCRDGNLHINEDVLLLEPIGNPDKGPVSVLLTDLYRRTQPIIRYHLDDVLEIDNKPCSCGSDFRVIRRIHGRSDDVFVLLRENGEHCYLFPDYIRRAINQSSDKILEFQAIQHSHHKIEIRLALGDESSRAQIESEILKNLTWRVEKIGAQLGTVEFSKNPPQRNTQSNKMIRVKRNYPWNF